MKYEFQEKGHKHFLDGKRATGVTTILGIIAKPALIDWSARMAVEYIEKVLDKKCEALKDAGNSAFGLLVNAITEALPDAKKAYAQKRDKAGEKGTNVHAIIEEWIKTNIHEQKELPEFSYPRHEETENRQVQNFMNWAVKNKVKFLESEKNVWSEKLFCAGICDFVCEINGEKLVGDIKTGSGIYPEHFYQVAAYRMFLQEMGEKDFKGSVIVNLKKDGTFDEDKDVALNYSYEDEKEAFLAAYTLYKVGKSFIKNKFNNSL